MGVILREMGLGRELTASQVHAMLSYGTEVTLGAVRKSVELLEKSELLTRERRGRNVVLIPTEKGYDWFRPLRPETGAPV